MTNLRIGHGYDVHKLTEGRKLILGGVEIPHHMGLLGHSDADVLLHALMDALLGSTALGDIGKHFPDTDSSLKDISSMLLLEKAASLLHEYGYTLVNADVTVIAQKPKLAPFLPKMVSNIAKLLNVPENAVNIKATTEEHLGFTGREEGIAAHAVVLVEKTK